MPSRIQVGGGGIALPAIYDVQFIDVHCSLADELKYSAPLELFSAAWADIADLVNGQFRAPDQVVSVFDSLAILQKFAGLGGAPIKSRAELVGVDKGPSPIVDGKITVSDLIAVLDGFSGRNYPFAPLTGMPCP